MQKVHAALILGLLLSFPQVSAMQTAPASGGKQASPAKSEALPKTVAILNNNGVMALQRGEFQAASNFFSQALELDPSYPYSRANLAICFNNMALKAPAKQALSYFHKSLLIDPDSAPTKQNLEALIASLGKNPKSFQDRVSLADQALQDKDYITAVVEFDAALAIQDDKDVRAKLASIPRTDNLFKVAQVKKRPTPPPVDFEAYMNALQSKIKAHWHPPKKNQSTKTEVHFKISKDGSLSKLELFKSSGLPDEDQSALQAVTETAPFDKLPAGAPASVDIAFSFGYNVSSNWHATPSEKRLMELAAQRVTLAKSLVAQNKIDDALQNLSEAQRIDPNNFDATKLSSSLLVQKAEKEVSSEKQADLLYQALDLEPGNAEAAKALSQSLTKAGHNPDSAAERVSLAESWMQKNNYRNARIEVGQALKLDRSNEAASKLLPKILTRESTGSLIDRWRNEVSKRNTAENHAGLGYAYEVSNDREAAKDEYKKALDVDQYCTYAKERLDALNQAPAEVSSSTSSPAPANRSETLQNYLTRGAALHAEKEYDMAIGEYMKAIKESPRSAEAWFEMASTLQDKGDYERAIKSFSRVFQIDPSNQKASEHLAECQKLLQEKSKGADAGKPSGDAAGNKSAE